MDTFWNYLSTGFAQVNVVQGLIIALVAAYLMYRWGSVFVVAVGAVVVHELVNALLPVLNSSGPFQLPPVVESTYWQYLLALYLGYVVAITVFYVIKRVLLNAQHAAA
jgi:hypothetical protein